MRSRMSNVILQLAVGLLFITIWITVIYIFQKPIYDNSGTNNLTIGTDLTIDTIGTNIRTTEDTYHKDFAFWAPLRDDIQLFGYSDRITDAVCTSIESAILAGWKFQLIGPTVTVPQNNMHFDSKVAKLFALSILMKVLPEKVTVVFADSLDVLYQRTFDEFENALLESDYQQGKIVFAGEQNCWPFNRSNKKTYHCPLMQGKKWTQDKVALGCKLQHDLYEHNQKILSSVNKTLNADNIYLNSGLSVGKVGNYSKIVEKSKLMVSKYPPLCVDDQGLFAWQLAGEETVPMSLDYNSVLFATVNMKELMFDNNDGLMKIWHNDKNPKNINRNNNITTKNNDLLSAPFMVHFNGGGKPLYNTTRNQMIEHKKKRMNIYKFLENKKFYVDGKKQKFVDVCDKYVKRHYYMYMNN